MSAKRKAIGISSGGLDSILSALVLKDQGIDVSWISFKTPFFSSDAALKAAKTLNIPIKIQDITEEYIPLLNAPKANFGRNMNPCMDCHSLMFSIAGKYMTEQKADFLFSGEVLGQRPKSQTKNSLIYVEKNSGFAGLILRPLSGKLLSRTIPEEKGWVNREKLYDITGRSRKTQIEMAEKYGIKDYPTPAGGCLLTDSIFSGKLKDILYIQKDYEIRELNLLQYGRHFRINEKNKVIVGRSEQDNNNILKYYNKDKDILIKALSMPSPFALIVSGRETSKMEQVGSLLCASYTKAKPGDKIDMKVTFPDKEVIITQVVQDKYEFKGMMV